MADPTSIFYTGDGVTTDRTFPFPYLSAEHVKVTVDGVATAFTFVNASTVRISPAPATGKTIKIYRETPKTPIIEWEDGVVILGRDMNAANVQNIYISEEAYDYAGGIAEEAKQFALDGLADQVSSALETARGELADDLDPKVAAANAAVTAAEAARDTAQATLATGEGYKNQAHTEALAAQAARDGIEATVGDAQTILNSFLRLFLGAKSVEPVVDNSGQPLTVGALFFHIPISKMKVWDGDSWQLSYNDYSAPASQAASDVSNDSGVTGDTVKDALNTLKNNKADASALDAKANTADVTAALAEKADADDVSTALAAKADASALASKADTSAVNTALAAKADASALAAKQDALGFTPLNAASYTASDVLTKVKSVDGNASGLDADLWKGANFTVSTSGPSGGVDGDFWFERQA